MPSFPTNKDNDISLLRKIVENTYEMSSEAGIGALPAGGTTGQVPVKQSNGDYDVAWDTPAGGGDLLSTANLSDLDDIPTALTNLGLDNVDNTSDATKNSASVTLTNKIISLDAALGTDNTFTGTQIVGRNAGATIAQWEAVYPGAAGTWLLADANGTGTYPARGLAAAAGTDGNPLSVVVKGTVRNDAWNWTPGGTIYLSATPGALTQSAPATSGDKVQQIGFALTADIAFFDFASGEYVTVE